MELDSVRPTTSTTSVSTPGSHKATTSRDNLPGSYRHNLSFSVPTSASSQSMHLSNRTPPISSPLRSNFFFYATDTHLRPIGLSSPSFCCFRSCFRVRLEIPLISPNPGRMLRDGICPQCLVRRSISKCTTFQGGNNLLSPEAQ